MDRKDRLQTNRDDVQAAPAPPKLRDRLPRPERLQQRRFLMMFSKMDRQVMATWIDDDGSCSKPGVHMEAQGSNLWHVYQDDAGKVWAIRCPRSLSNRESKFQVGYDSEDREPIEDQLRRYRAWSLQQMRKTPQDDSQYQPPDDEPRGRGGRGDE